MDLLVMLPSDGYSLELIFQLNSNFRESLLRLGLNFILLYATHSGTFGVFLFRLSALLVKNCTVGNKEVS